MSEHSHAISLFLHLADRLGWGEIVEVDCSLKIRETYDEEATIRIKFSSENFGWVLMDFLTSPAIKTLTVGSTITRIGADNRPDDFAGQIEHVGMLMHDETLASPIDLTHGVNVMKVIRASVKSHFAGREVRLDEIQL